MYIHLWILVISYIYIYVGMCSVITYVCMLRRYGHMYCEYIPVIMNVRMYVGTYIPVVLHETHIAIILLTVFSTHPTRNMSPTPFPSSP